MHKRMSVKRSTFCFIFLIIIANLVSCQNYDECITNGDTSRAQSIFLDNLNNLLSRIPENIKNNGFYNASIGEDPDQVIVIALCRGDLQLEECRSCIRNASLDITNICTDTRQAIRWTPQCMIWHSNEPIYDSLTLYPKYNVTDPGSIAGTGVCNELRVLLDGIRWQAANGSSLLKVASGNRNLTDSDQRIYALMQCTPDLTPSECSHCLIDASQQSSTVSVSIGVHIYRASCQLHYDVHPFYNETRIQELRLQSSVAMESGNRDTIIIVVATVVATLILLAVFIGFILRKRMMKKSRTDDIESDEEELGVSDNLENLQYDFEKIRVATNDFCESNKLGKGGFGVVYRGKLLNGKEIAVKRLSGNSGQGGTEFKNEVKLLARLQHKNLVRLLYFCLERREKLLVYEFLQNSSLDNFIFDPTKRAILDWTQRYKIIGGIARGLLYLHEDSRLKIIHRDLKPSNVLLDGNMNPKISDFGTARLFMLDETEANTKRIVGTFGYMAPEYVMHGHFSCKSDVFSFGVLVLEIISGQKNNSSKTRENLENYLTRLAWKNWHDGTLSDFVDPMMSKSSIISSEILRCIHIALLCVQDNAPDRPTMPSVVQMLTSPSIVLSKPIEPTYFLVINTSSTLKNSRETTHTDSYRQQTMITEVYPR